MTTNKEALQIQKEEIDHQIRLIRSDLNYYDRRSEIHRQKSQELADLIRQSQQLQRQIAKAGGLFKVFFEVSREVLPARVFEKILQAAVIRRDSGGR